MESVEQNECNVFPSIGMLRRSARRDLNGNWSKPVLGTLIILAATALCALLEGDPGSPSPAGSFIALLVMVFFMWPLDIGYSQASLRFHRGEKNEFVSNIFEVFNLYWRNLGLVALKAVYIFLWTLLLIVPGIVMSYAYEMAYFIRLDHPEWDAADCIRASKQMMKGYKWKLFVLDLSFIGWILLSIISLGIGSLWVIPWIQVSHAHFYEELKRIKGDAILA